MSPDAPVEARRAAWDRLWAWLLAAPPAEDEPEAEQDDGDPHADAA